MSGDIDIKGLWTGSYSYSSTAEIAAIPFKARLSVGSGGAVTGLVIEDHMHGTKQMKADVAGTLGGRTLRFTKRYITTNEQEAADYSRTVEYEGEIAPDGQSIEGSWSLPDDSGVFSMKRPDQ